MEVFQLIERQVEVKLKTGLQARPAALFVQEANRYSSDIFLEKGTKKVNAKSIMGIMSLAISAGTTITIKIDGKDENEAMAGLVAFVENEG